MSITQFFIFCSVVCATVQVSAWPFLQATEPTCSIMLDPAGDAHHTGRKLDDSFERGITLQCAEQLKLILEEQYPTIRIVLTRFPGETLQSLQNANFANRLEVDCYISIHFYQEKEAKPSLAIYQFSYGEDFVSALTNNAFYSYDKAYIINSSTTKQWALMMQHVLEKDVYRKQFDVSGIYKLPFKPLIGIKSPALALEVGLKTKDDWHQYASAFAESLRPVIAAIKQEKMASQ